MNVTGAHPSARRFARGLVDLLIVALSMCTAAQASGQAATATASQQNLDRLTLTTDAVAPQRFVAAHGERAVMMGYPGQGLEMWAYPVQVFSGYRIDIKAEGAARTTPGELLLRRIEVAPQQTTRIYVGANFVVRERIFVPLDRPGAIVSYTVEGRQPVEITVTFTPVLDLMWPAAVGGQSAEWSDALGGYVLSEPLHRFGAVIVSPNTIAHDSTENSAVRAQAGLGFTIRPAAVTDGKRRATVFVGLDPESVAAGTEVKALAAEQARLNTDAAERYTKLMAGALEITTPDAQVNEALAWAEIALDQAWVCDPGVGCGEVAGYGPSRNARRPQYDWFFAGDGLIAVDGLLAVGEHDRARQEIEFILKYQDAQTGMIWHELSQSAGYLDWIGKYPYMFVHVDLTFQFLPAVARYVAATGDADFARQHWQALERAYHYCEAQIDPATKLPRIPAGKEGGNEQDRMSDDLDLSSEWIAAAESFTQLAVATGQAEAADKAREAATAARPAIAARYWDAARGFPISGHTDTGKPIFEERSHGGALITQHVFSAEQNTGLLDKLASADFQADWGTRGVSAAARTYDPDSYARGSVFALATANMASTFWQAHRPVTAEAIWSTLPPLSTLDALGHIHEVLAGDFYHQQAESVPEQTWSSAGFLDTTVHGLLGLEVEAMEGRVVFAPHLPADWQQLTVDHVRAPHATLGFRVNRDAGATRLDLQNDGDVTDVVFDPEIPLGATKLGATCDGKRTRVTPEQHPQDQHARIELQARHGEMHCELRYQGGVEILPDAAHAQVGDRSQGLKVTGVSLEGAVLTVKADAFAGEASGFSLITTNRPEVLEGGRIDQISPGRYLVSLEPPPDGTSHYVSRSIRIRVARGIGK